MSEKEPQFLGIEKESLTNEKEKTGESEKKIEKKRIKMLLILNNLHYSFNNEGIENYVSGGWAIEGYGGNKREHDDIDFLMWEKDLEKIKEILQKENYKVIEGEYDQEGKFHKFKNNKLMGRKEGINIDFGLMTLDEETQEIFSHANSKYRIPKEFLDSKKIVLQNGSNQISKFYTVSKELLLAMIIASKKKKHQADIKFLKREIGNEEKIQEIKNQYAFYP